MQIHISPSDGVPIYLQIVNQIFMRWYRGEAPDVTGLRWADIMDPDDAGVR